MHHVYCMYYIHAWVTRPARRRQNGQSQVGLGGWVGPVGQLQIRAPQNCIELDLA